MSGEGPRTVYWKAVRQMLDHENTIVSNRIGWLTATQAFLLAAIGHFWAGPPVVRWTIVLTGFASCVSIGFALLHADRSIWALIRDWNAFAASHPAASEERLPPIYGLAVPGLKQHREPQATQKLSAAPSGRWLYPWNVMPWVFAASWIGLLVAQLSTP